MSRCDSERTNSIVNLTNVIARGDFSPALRAALMEREQEIADSTAKIFEAKPDSVTSRVSNIRGLVEQRMKDLAGLLNGDAPRARGTGQTHHGNYDDAEGRHYIASGSWDLLGRGRIDGAGGGKWTERLPVRFDWRAAA